jgi:AcrR family transcriptional regulator
MAGTVVIRAFPETLKERHNSLTRELILQTALDELEQGSPEGLTMRTVARRSNMAERTLFRHFASREDLLDELALRVIARIDQPALPSEISRLRDAPQGLYSAYEARANLTRAAVNSELFDRIRESVARDRWNAVKALVDQAAPERTEHERKLGAANIRLVLSATSWNYYRSYFGFSLRNSIEAARLVIEQTVDHLTTSIRP